MPPESFERRDFAGELEFRAADGALSFTGYAAVFNADSEPLPFIETIAPGAFSRSLAINRDIRFLVDHDESRLLASVQAGTLRLAEDSRGLKVDADLAPTSYGNDLKILADRREIRAMSFSFRPVKDGNEPGDTWSADRSRRELRHVRLKEVSALTGTQPAYPQTTAFMRKLATDLTADVDMLADALAGLAEGRDLSTEQLDLLDAAVRSLRPPTEPIPTIPVSVATKLALIQGREAHVDIRPH